MAERKRSLACWGVRFSPTLKVLVWDMFLSMSVACAGGGDERVMAGMIVTAADVDIPVRRLDRSVRRCMECSFSVECN